MKLPVAIGGAIATALTAGIALVSELDDVSHPWKQAVVIAGGLLIAVVGYLTIAPSDAAAIAAGTAPPYAIPAPLPTSAVSTPAAPVRATPVERAAIDAAAAAAVPPTQKSLP